MTSPSAASNDVFIFASVSGTSTQNFQLRGGVYLIALAAASWGTVTLNVLAADGTSYVPFQTWSGNAGATLTLVAGSYQLSYASLGAATLSLAQQPPSPDWRLESLTQPLPISASGDVTTITTLPGTTELDLVGGANGAWLFTPTNDSGGAGVGTGDVTSGGTGRAFLYTGATSSAGTTGDVLIVTGDTAGGTSGEVLIASGTAGGGTRGNIILDAPAVLAPLGDVFYVASAPGTGGNESTGAMALESGGPTGTGDSGNATFGTSDAIGGAAGGVLFYAGSSGKVDTVGGSIVMTSGAATNGNADGGHFLLQTAAGHGSGVRGSITLDALRVLILNLPTSASGLATGTLWNSTGTLKVA